MNPPRTPLRLLFVCVFFVAQAGISFGLTSEQGQEGADIAVFSGSPHERGLAQGRLWKTDIAGLINTIFDEYLPNVLARYWAYRLADKMESHLPASLVEELEGLAEGSGLDYHDVLVGNLIQDLLQLYGYEAACSAYLIEAGRSSTGHMLYGRNLDWYHDLAPKLRRLTRPMIFEESNDTRILSIGLPGMVGILTGVNDKGVAMSLMYSFHDDYTAEGFPATMLYRHILSQASTFEEALSLFEANTPRTIPINTLLADGLSAAVLESTATKLAIRRPDANGLLYSANHFESEDLIEGDEPGRDYRWASLTRHDGSVGTLSFDTIRQTISEAAMEDEAFTNVLAMFIDYQTMTLYWGTGGPPAASASLHAINLRQLQTPE